LEWPLIISLILGAIGTANAVLTGILKIIEVRSQKPDLRIRIPWGYFEEKAVRNKWTKLELEFLIDNKGKASTTITKIVADVPAEEGGIMSAEGKIF